MHSKSWSSAECLSRLCCFTTSKAGGKRDVAGINPDRVQMDLISFLLGNESVELNQKIFVQADEECSHLTKGNIIELTRQMVAGWRIGLGAARGFTVCVHAFNSFRYPTFFYGIVGAGGCFTGSNPAFTSTELEHHFRISKASYVITELDNLSKVIVAAESCQIPLSHILIADEDVRKTVNGFKSWRYLLQHGDLDWVRFRSHNEAASTPAALFSTSGTTGLPKMAVRSHKSFIVECMTMNDASRKPYEIKRLLSIPFFHAFAAPLALTCSIYNGHTTYVLRRFQQELFENAISKFGITESAIVPPVIFRWLALEHPPKYPSLRTVYCAGAPLDATTQEEALSLFHPEGRLTQVWGTTEAGWISTFAYPEKDSTGSVGRLLSGIEARVVDADGKPCSGFNSGEILIRSRTTMLRYSNNRSATRAAVSKDGWLCTGDIGYLHAGKVYIVDRIKDLIKVRGWQVSPSEIEGVLRTHPLITDAAVIGVMDDNETSEIPRAYLVAKRLLDPDTVRDFLLQHLARYKVSECQVVFMQKIPRNAGGKILKWELRDLARQDFSVPREVGTSFEQSETSTEVATSATLTALSSLAWDKGKSCYHEKCKRSTPDSARMARHRSPDFLVKLKSLLTLETKAFKEGA